MKEYLTVDNIRILIIAASLLFGIFQYIQKRKVKHLIVLEAIQLHKNIAVALGATDSAIIAISNGQNPSASVGRAQGLCQAVLHESAKLYCNLKKTSMDDIDELIKNGQIAENYKEIYYSYSSKRRGMLGFIFNWMF